MSSLSPKVLMITPFSRQQRGNSLTSARLKKGLADCGFNIDLLSLEENQAYSCLREQMRANEYALIHAFHARHLGRVLEDHPGLQALPIILTTTGTDIHYDMYGGEKSCLEKAFQAADKIVVFHQDFIKQISQSYPEYTSKLVTIAQGIHLPEGLPWERQQLDLRDNDFVFFLPSGLRPVKNIALTIDALEVIKPEYPQLQLLIMGADLNPDYSAAILQRISSLPWVKYLGEIAHEQIRSLMNLVDAVINSSQAEGQPQAALEAMSMGKPCILTAVPGNKNIIEQGREGFYIRNKEEFAQAARALIDNPQMTKKMGLAARRLVEEKYNLDQELDAYAALYRELM